MNFDRFEKDFNKWMLEAYNENSVLKKLLDDNFQKDIDELSKHFRSDASAFVIDLQDLTERIFTDGIAKHEKMENVRSSREVLRVLENRKRVRKEQVDIIKRLNSLSPNDFNGISFPSKEDFLEIKRAKVTQVFKLVDFKKDAEETNEKEEEHVNRLTDSEKEKFQSSKNILTKLKNAKE